MAEVASLGYSQERVDRYLKQAECGWKELEEVSPAISDDPLQITDEQSDYILELPQLRSDMEYLQEMFDGGKLDEKQTVRFNALLATADRLGAELERVLSP